MLCWSSSFGKILSKGFLKSVVEKGSYLKQQLSNATSEFPSVFESVRGEGLMLGVMCDQEFRCC